MASVAKTTNQASVEAQREAKFAAKGSQRWLQLAVRNNKSLLDTAIANVLRRTRTPIDWISPIEETRFGEYRGDAFIRILGLQPIRPLSDFWPARGPLWDGLAKLSENEIILVEAKAHISEMVTSPVRASSRPLAQIRKSLEETRLAIAPHTSNDWTGIFYQYTNRLAHLYFLRTVNKVKAHLVLVYFVNAADVNGPTSIAEWQGAIRLMKSYMGLHRHKLKNYVHDVFIDVRELG